tara:strand:+ start:4343 stop:8104 length:3762 start_codon:yes stop_codon:yes gene_type:complete
MLAGLRGKERRRSRPASKAVWAVMAFGGWCVAGGLVVLLLLESSGLFTRLVEHELRAALGDSDHDLSVGEARLSWLNRTLIVEDVSLGPDGRDATAEEVRLLINWRPGSGFVLERLLVKNGHVHLSRSLQEAIDAMGGQEDSMSGSSRLPDFGVEDFRLSAEGPDGEPIELGRVDAHLKRNGDQHDLAGRLRMPGQSGQLWLTGGIASDGAIEWVGTAEALELSLDLLPAGALADAWTSLAPSGTFDLSTRGRYVPGVSVIPEATLQLGLRDGVLRLPHLERPDDRPVHDVTANLIARFRGGDSDDLWKRDAWDVGARIAARWENLEPVLTIRGGTACPQEWLAETWLHLPRVGLTDEVQELVHDERAVTDLRAMLKTHGEGSVSIGARFPTGWTPRGAKPRTAVASCVAVHATGDLSVAYVGEPNREQDMQRNLGFPLMVDHARGRVTHIYEPGLEFPEQLGLFGITGRHKGGPVRVEGSMWVVPRWPDPEHRPHHSVPMDFHLNAQAEDLAVDGELHAALDGLAGIEGISEIFPTYSPEGGAIDFTLDLRKPVDLKVSATRLDLQLEGLDVRWASFPATLHEADGDLQFESNGRALPDGRTRLVVNAHGRSDIAQEPIRLRGRVDGHGIGIASSWIEASVPQLNLRHPDFQSALTFASPEVQSALATAHIKGFVNVTASQVQHSSAQAGITRLEILSDGTGLQGQPEAFPMDTRQVRGRSTVRMESILNQPDALPLTTAHAYMEGRWLGAAAGVPIALTYESILDEPPILGVRVAGVDLENPTVTGALIEALMREQGSETDTSKLDFRGHIDADCTFVLSPEPDEPLISSELSLMARLESLGLGGIQLLTNVSGPVDFDGVNWTGERVTAVLGSTPVVLSDLIIGPRGDGMRLGMNLSAQDVPFDDEHLQHFLDEGTRRTLLDELGARGRFDILDSRLTLDSMEDGETTLMLDNAKLRVRDAAVKLGLPVEIRRADDIDLSLRFERGRVRAVGRIGSLFGTLAGRKLDAASMQMTYIEPRLTIEDMTGSFEGGEARSLGHGDRGGSGFFSVDLEPPFPFSLSTELDRVDVGSLTAGAFNSDFANEGTLDAEMRLHGDLLHPTGIRGSGFGRLTDSSLWAIPVFQALFAQLGFDSTAIFSEMEAHFDVQDGVIDMRGMRVKSDLLSLVGEGTLDMDGSLRQDLEVRYSLVDRLGPLTRLVYEIQNSLLRVSIRGDMSRPTVILKGLFSQFFAPTGEGLHLPVPALSRLPRRF